MSTIFSNGLVGVSIQKSLVSGRTGARSREIAHVDVAKSQAVALEDAREQAKGAAVKVVADDDVIPG
jgi:hypothetical protein